MKRSHKLVRLTLEEAAERAPKAEVKLQDTIANFIKNHPAPSDKEIHALAQKHKFEELVYGLLGGFFGAGKAKDFKGEYDPEQIKMGVKVEMEHTSNAMIAKRIAMDHLAEFPDYYTRLAKMEKEAEAAKKKG